MLAMGRLAQRNLWRLVFHVFGSRKKGLPVPFRNMRRVFESAGMEYIPKKYAGEMTLFIASDEPQEPSGFNQLGWAGLAEKGITIIKVAGDHETMMNEPHVRVLGSKITQCMETI